MAGTICPEKCIFMNLILIEQNHIGADEVEVNLCAEVFKWSLSLLRGGSAKPTRIKHIYCSGSPSNAVPKALVRGSKVLDAPVSGDMIFIEKKILNLFQIVSHTYSNPRF